MLVSRDNLLLIRGLLRQRRLIRSLLRQRRLSTEAY